MQDPYHALLRNHALLGQFDGYRSISVSGDLRAIYTLVAKDTAYFVAFGTHSELYG